MEKFVPKRRKKREKVVIFYPIFTAFQCSTSLMHFHATQRTVILQIRNLFPHIPIFLAAKIQIPG